MTNGNIIDGVGLREMARCDGFRALAWSGDVLYASRGYEVLRARFDEGAARSEAGKAGSSTSPSLRSGSGRNDKGSVVWERVGEYDAPLWRRLTSRARLTSRLVRDGFHALAVGPSGALVGAVPGAIVTCAVGAVSAPVMLTRIEVGAI